MNRKKLLRRTRRMAAILTAATLFQLGGCDFGTITVTQTIGVQQLLIDLIHGFIINPIDDYVTTAINNAFNQGG